MLCVSLQSTHPPPPPPLHPSPTLYVMQSANSMVWRSSKLGHPMRASPPSPKILPPSSLNPSPTSRQVPCSRPDGCAAPGWHAARAGGGGWHHPTTGEGSSRGMWLGGPHTHCHAVGLARILPVGSRPVNNDAIPQPAPLPVYTCVCPCLAGAALTALPPPRTMRSCTPWVWQPSLAPAHASPQLPWT